MKRLEKIISRTMHYAVKKYPRLGEELVEKTLQIRYEMPFPPTHYYSPLPDIPNVKRRLTRWYHKESLEGISFDATKQQALLDQLKAYSKECDQLPNFAQVTADGYGLGYGEVEAHFLHLMIRHLKPRKIIEIGSGVSTYFSLNALEMNSHEGESKGEMICVEPYPSTKLKDLAAKKNLVLHAKEVQDLELAVFLELSENDILFIDSSHVSKIDSDVNWLYLEVLPRLKKGVVVHIHDMPLPYLSIPREHPLFTHFLFWNEPVVVKAFLLFNETFEIALCQSMLHFECPAAIKEVVAIYDKQDHFPSSLWLVKRR